MTDIKGLMEQYGEVTPIFDHFGLITSSRERAADFLMSIPGSKILVTRDVEFVKEQMTVGEPVKIRIHHIEVAGQDVEVIEPVDSPNAYLTKFLETHGDCFHHLALTFEKHAEHLSMCKILTAQGYRCVFEARVRDLLVNYYESSDNSGIAHEGVSDEVEFLKPRQRVQLQKTRVCLVLAETGTADAHSLQRRQFYS